MLTQKINWLVEATLLSKPNNKVSSCEHYTTYTSLVTMKYKILGISFKRKRSLVHHVSKKLSGELCRHQQLKSTGCSLCQHNSTYATIFDHLFFFKKGIFLQAHRGSWYRFIRINSKGVEVFQLPWDDEETHNILATLIGKGQLLPISSDFVPKTLTKEELVRQVC